jgi:hypothetical protein
LLPVELNRNIASQLHFGPRDAPPQKAKQRKWEARKGCF